MWRIVQFRAVVGTSCSEKPPPHTSRQSIPRGGRVEGIWLHRALWCWAAPGWGTAAFLLEATLAAQAQVGVQLDPKMASGHPHSVLCSKGQAEVMLVTSAFGPARASQG